MDVLYMQQRELVQHAMSNTPSVAPLTSSPLTRLKTSANSDGASFFIELEHQNHCSSARFIEPQVPTDMERWIELVKEGDINVLQKWAVISPQGLTQVDKSGRNLVHVACIAGRLDMLEVILANGIEWLPSGTVPPSNFYRPPMAGAGTVRVQIIQIMEYLVHNSTQLLNAQDEEGNTPLHLLVETDRPALIGPLVEHWDVATGILNNLKLGPIHLAVEQNRIECLKVISSLPQFDLNLKGEMGSTALMHASANDRTECLEILHKAGANIFIPNDAGFFAMNIAARSGAKQALETIVRLVGRGVLSWKDAEGNLPLHGAVDSGDLDAVRVVVEAGAQIDALQEDHSTPLHFACTRGALDMVQLMFELQPEKKARCLAMRDINGSTLLHIAVRFDFRNIAEFLVKEGANIEAEDNTGRTPLLVAAHCGANDCVNFLLEWGADARHRDLEGRNFILLAILNRRTLLVVEQLTKIGMDVSELLNDKDNYGCTALHYSSIEGFPLATDMLIKNGAQVFSRTNNKDTPLHFAARAFCGMSALHMACLNGHAKTVKFLLQVGSHMKNYACRMGFTPLHVAAMSGHEAVVALLLSDGANISMNREGSTFLDLALQKHHKHVCLTAIEHERWREVLAAPSLHYPTEFFGIIEEMPAIAKFLMDRCITNNGMRPTEPEYATTNDFTFLQTEWTDEERAKYVYQQSCTVKTTTEEEARSALLNANGRADQVESKNTSLCESGERRLVPLRLKNTIVEEGGTGGKCLKVQSLEILRSDSPTHSHVWSTTPLVVRKPVPKDCSGGACNKMVETQPQLDASVGKWDDGKRALTEDRRVELFDEKEDRRKEREQQLTTPLPVLNHMAQNSRIDLLSHPLCKAYLKMKWEAYGKIEFKVRLGGNHIYTIFFVLVILSNNVLCHIDMENLETECAAGQLDAGNCSLRLARTQASTECQSTAWSIIPFIVLAALTIFGIVMEFLVLIRKQINFLCDFEEMLRSITYVLTIEFLGPAFFTGFVIMGHTQWEAGIIAFFLVCVNELQLFQKTDLTAIYVVMFWEILKSLSKALLLFSVLILGFGVVFFVLLQVHIPDSAKEIDEMRAQLASNYLPISIVHAFLTMVGEYGFADIWVPPIMDPSKSDHIHFLPLSIVFILLFLFVATILLVNLLIGLAVGDIEKVRVNAHLKSLALHVSNYTDIELSIPKYWITKRDERVFTIRNCRCGVMLKVYRWAIQRLGLRECNRMAITLTEENPADRLEREMKRELKKERRMLKDVTSNVSKELELLRALSEKLEVKLDSIDLCDYDESGSGAVKPSQQRRHKLRSMRVESVAKQRTNGSSGSARIGAEKEQLESVNWEQLRARVRGVRWRRQEHDSTEEAVDARSVASLVSRPGSTRSQKN